MHGNVIHACNACRHKHTSMRQALKSNLATRAHMALIALGLQNEDARQLWTTRCKNLVVCQLYKVNNLELCIAGGQASS